MDLEAGFTAKAKKEFVPVAVEKQAANQESVSSSPSKEKNVRKLLKKKEVFNNNELVSRSIP